MPRRNDRVHTVERPPQHEAVARLEADLRGQWHRWHADDQTRRTETPRRTQTRGNTNR